MFPVYLRRLYILLWLGRMFSLRLLDSSGWSYHLSSVYWFYVWMSYLLSKVGHWNFLLFLCCFLRELVAPFSSLFLCFIYLSILMCVYIYICVCVYNYIFMVKWSFHHYIMSSLSLLTVFLLKVYIIWYNNLWVFYPVPLAYISGFVPAQYCLDDWSLVV